MRRAYLAITAVAVAFVLFSVFVPLIPEYVGPLCPSGGPCLDVAYSAYVSLSFHYFHFGGVLVGPSYEFRTSAHSVFMAL